MEVANNFNEDKINQFEERLDAISGMREGLISRLNNLTNMVGTVNLNTDLFTDVQDGLSAGAGRIRSIRSAAADRVLALSRLD